MFGERIKLLERFAKGVADIQLERNPLSTEVVLIFNEIIRDQYQDALTREDFRVVKTAVVSKTPTLSYVQELFDELLEDDLENLPWTVSLTMTNLTRTPTMDDCILIDGTVYNISKVTPLNRRVQSIITLAVYPDRTSMVDPLKIHKATVDNSVLSIVYGGHPEEISLDGKNWRKFSSKLKVDVVPEYIYIKAGKEIIRYAI